MKSKILLVIVVIVMSVFITQPVEAQGIWSGYLQTDNRLRLYDDYEFSWQEYRLNLELEVKPSEKVKLYSEVWLRSWGFPVVQSSSDLFNKDKVSPWNLAFREAYLNLTRQIT
jgi:hypothetical protein